MHGFRLLVKEPGFGIQITIHLPQRLLHKSLHTKKKMMHEPKSSSKSVLPQIKDTRA